MINSKLQLIDVTDNPAGEENIYLTHQHPAKLHRAVSVWLFNDKGEVLLQQRSEKKITKALEWGNAVCGNVRSNENYHQCAVRRLKEEIGVKNALIRPIYKFSYKAWCNDKYGENELDQVFVGQYLSEVKLNKDEAADFAWINWQQFRKSVKEVVNKLEKPARKSFLNPSTTTSMSLDELKQNTQSVRVTVSNSNYIIVPWTAMMVLDERLMTAVSRIL